MFLGSNHRMPFYVAIIRESRTLPHLPNEIWLLIDEALLELVIIYHERKFEFRFNRIRPFQCIFAVPCQVNWVEHRNPSINVRKPTFQSRQHLPASIYLNRVRRVFNITNIVTIVDREDQTQERSCRNALLEGKALALMDMYQ